MKSKKFIKSVQTLLGIEDQEKKGKRKSIKNLLKKLEAKRKETKNKISQNDSEELQLDLAILNAEIEKGKKILKELSS